MQDREHEIPVDSVQCFFGIHTYENTWSVSRIGHMDQIKDFNYVILSFSSGNKSYLVQMN